MHRTRDEGVNWEVISPDLTTNDITKQGYSGGEGITRDNTGVEVYGADLDDEFTIDFGFGGEFTLPDGVLYDGGNASGVDSMAIAGGSFGTVQYNQGSGGNGLIEFDNGLEAEYFDLEPILDTATVDARIFNFFAIDGEIGQEIILRDDDDPANDLSVLEPGDGGDFESVTFTFGRGGHVLEDVSFKVEPGEILAVAGPSGSGKSTIADLLARHFDPDSGRILLDGIDLKDLSLMDLRRQIVTVDQEPFVFNASIAENIRYARPGASPSRRDSRFAEPASSRRHR